jgi:hypothetical protein
VLVKRTVNLYVVPAVLLVLIVLPFLLFWSSLPDPMAIHWGVSGDPNGYSPPVLLVAGLAVAYAAITLSVYRVVVATPGEMASFVAGLFGVGGLLAAVSWRSVLANRDAGSWQGADPVGWFEILGVLAIALVAGAIGWFAAGGNASRAERVPGETPTIDVSDPASAVWSGRGFGRVTTVIGVAVILIGLFTWGVVGMGLALVGLIALMFALVRVTVAQSGVVVSLGWWGFPRWRVPLDSVTRAEVEVVRPMAYGGWGYRARPGVRAIVVRSGDGLRLVRDDGADLVYTVEDAQTAAGLVNAIIGARR